MESLCDKCRLLEGSEALTDGHDNLSSERADGKLERFRCGECNTVWHKHDTPPAGTTAWREGGRYWARVNE